MKKFISILMKLQYVVYICIIGVIVKKIVGKIHNDMSRVGSSNRRAEDIPSNDSCGGIGSC